MRFKPLLIPLALAGYAGLAAQPALAGPSGYPVQAPAYNPSVMIRIGGAYIEPEDRVFSGTERFFVDDLATEDVEEAYPIDVFNRVTVDDDVTWYISGVWKPMEHWGLELYYADGADNEATLYSAASAVASGGDATTPPTSGEFIGDFTADIGDFETNVTSLYANWYPLDANCLIQPYVGLGVTYVDIEDEFIRTVFPGDPLGGGFSDLGGGHGVLRLGSDFSWTAQVGVDFHFGADSAWLINASVMYLDSEPDMELGFDTATLPSFFEPTMGIDVTGAPIVGPPIPAVLQNRIRTDLDYNPWIFNLGVGYRFSF